MRVNFFHFDDKHCNFSGPEESGSVLTTPPCESVEAKQNRRWFSFWNREARVESNIISRVQKSSLCVKCFKDSESIAKQNFQVFQGQSEKFMFFGSFKHCPPNLWAIKKREIQETIKEIVRLITHTAKTDVQHNFRDKTFKKEKTKKRIHVQDESSFTREARITWSRSGLTRGARFTPPQHAKQKSICTSAKPLD